MTEKFKSASAKVLISFSAIFLIFIFILNGAFNFAAEAIAKSNGSLKTFTMQYDEFRLESLRYDSEGNLASSDTDPQLILEEKMKLTRIKFYMESTIYPGEMVMYYTVKEGQGFSERKRVWAKPIQGQDNWYEIDLPMKTVLSIRIDPTIYAGNRLYFGDFIFNEEKSFADYFKVSYGDVFNLMLYTGILSSILRFIQEILTKKVE